MGDRIRNKLNLPPLTQSSTVVDFTPGTGTQAVAIPQPPTFSEGVPAAVVLKNPTLPALPGGTYAIESHGKPPFLYGSPMFGGGDTPKPVLPPASAPQNTLFDGDAAQALTA